MKDGVAENVRQMHMQRAAQGNVNDLHSSADRQGRHVAAHDLERQGDFHLVSCPINIVNGFVHPSAIQRGVYVTAPSQNECIDPPRQDGGPCFARGHQHGHSLRSPD
jgi:hypothetical protein